MPHQVIATTPRVNSSMTPPTTRPPLLATLLAAFHFAPIYCQLPGQHAVGQKESYVPLIQALVDEDLSRVDELLATGDEAQLNGLDVITPLYAAQEYVRSSKQRHTVVRKLLKAGALADGQTNDGSTTLMLAAYHGDVRSAHMLLDHGADPLRNNQQGYNAITAATQGGHSELAEMLREHVGESGLRKMAGNEKLRDEL